MALASELRGHVVEALRSPHANFVLQKCVATLEPEALQFVIDEIACGSAEKAAKHKFGCRVFQRLIERCPAAQVSELVDAVIADFTAVSRHPYGNYVMQHLLEHATFEQRHRLSQLVESDVRGLAADAFGVTVVSGVLSKAPREGQVRVARALLREQGLLMFVACSRHGHVAATRTLQVLEGAEREEVRRMLLVEEATLRASRFGRSVFQHL